MALVLLLLLLMVRTLRWLVPGGQIRTLAVHRAWMERGWWTERVAWCWAHERVEPPDTDDHLSATTTTVTGIYLFCTQR
uniref:Putative secreted protein n=1 Tax=Anopheles marajoara TaxID=58244 RepID=A0A2M4CD99_9DIPT